MRDNDNVMFVLDYNTTQCYRHRLTKQELDEIDSNRDYQDDIACYVCEVLSERYGFDFDNSYWMFTSEDNYDVYSF